MIDGFAIERASRGIVPKIGNEIAAFLEVLIAGGTLLPVPAGLVDHHGGRQDRKPFNGESQVREVRNAAVAVLEIESVEELLGLLLVQFGERFAHGKRRARVLRHTVGLDLGIGSMNGIDLGFVFRAGRGTTVISAWVVSG